MVLNKTDVGAIDASDITVNGLPFVLSGGKYNVDIVDNTTLESLGGVHKSRTINNQPLSGNVVLTAVDVNAVPTSRTINGNPLTGDVIFTLAELGGVPTTRTVNSKPLTSDVIITLAELGGVPTTRTVNGKSLASDISISAADVQAVPQTRTVNAKSLNNDIILNSDDVGCLPSAKTKINGAVFVKNGTTGDWEMTIEAGGGSGDKIESPTNNTAGYKNSITAVTNALTVSTNNLNIGTTTNLTNFVLYGNSLFRGTIDCNSTVSAATISLTSDERLKSNIVKLTDVSDVMRAVEVTSYIKNSKSGDKHDCSLHSSSGV